MQYLTGLLLGTGEWCLGDFTADGYRITEWEISRFCFQSVKTCLVWQKNGIVSAKIFNDLASSFFFRPWQWIRNYFFIIHFGRFALKPLCEFTWPGWLDYRLWGKMISFCIYCGWKISFSCSRLLLIVLSCL